MRMLAIFSNPPDSTPLRLDKEDKVLATLGRQFSKTASIERLHASEVDDIHKWIIDGAYDIIHLSGHGSPDGIYLDKGDLSKQGELVNPDRLVSLLALAKKQPLLVALLCCYSDSHVAALANAAPFVVTSIADVPDEACILFAGGLYECLLPGNSVQSSFDHAVHLLKAKGFAPSLFALSRSCLVARGDSLMIESTPQLHRDSIWVNMDEVADSLDALGMSREEVLHQVARKLTVHYWIFDRSRDQVLLPVGNLLFGEFTWSNARDVVYCKKLVRLRSDIPQKHWAAWVRLLTSYNDLASCEYRYPQNQSEPIPKRLVVKALRILQRYVQTRVKPLREELPALGCEHLLPQVEFVMAECDNAADHVDLDEYERAVVALDMALTNYHQLVTGLQPPEDTPGTKDKNGQ